MLLAVLDLQDTATGPDSTVLAGTAGGAAGLVVLAPLAALCAALSGSRLRSAGHGPSRWVRSPLQVLISLAAAPILVGSAALLVAVVTRTGTSVPELRTLALAFGVLAAWSLVGAAVGLRIPFVMSGPAVLLGCYLWIVLPLTIEPLWVRHLTGVFLDCCGVEDDLAWQAVLGAWSVTVGLALSALLLASSITAIGSTRRWAARSAIVITPLVVGLVAGGVSARGLGAYPTVPRAPSAAVCSATVPEVCLWPEHRDHVPLAAAAAGKAVQAWSAVGLTTPQRFTEAWADRRPSTARFDLTAATAADEQSAMVALSTTLVPRDAPLCAQVMPWPGEEAIAHVSTWAALTAGVEAGRLRSVRPDILRAARTVRSMPHEQQVVWVEAWQRAARDCSVPAPRLPPR